MHQNYKYIIDLTIQKFSFQKYWIEKHWIEMFNFSTYLGFDLYISYDIYRTDKT
jgi:hypothetical protein